MRVLPAVATLFALCTTTTGARAAGPAEFIRVEVQGTLRTGVVAIGAETTGTTITSGGVTWEVDFGNDTRLRRAAENLGGQRVLLTGTLERRRGVEVRERWIVRADSLKPAGKAEPPAGAGGFSAIEVHQTGGFAGVDIEYRIEADGRFTMESRRQSAKGQLDAESRQSLARAVAAIDWKTLPKELRARNVNDDFQYEITVKTKTATHRVLYDGTAAVKVPALATVLRTLDEIRRAGSER